MQVGQIWRSSLGGHKMYVVAVDDKFAYMKRADMPKKVLANAAGGYPVARGEWGEWTLLVPAQSEGVR